MKNPYTQPPALTGESDSSGLIPPSKTGAISAIGPKVEFIFSKYQEDGTLRLFKRGSYLSEETAGYSDFHVTVKVLIKTPSQKFMVCLPVTREQLDRPGAEQWLMEKAWECR